MDERIEFWPPHLRHPRHLIGLRLGIRHALRRWHRLMRRKWP
jgi:hypothetical protein